MGRAEIDVLTGRQSELPVELCKGTGRREAQGARGTTPGPSSVTPVVGG